MARSDVRIHGITVGRVLVGDPKGDGTGRVSVRLNFKPDHVGMMHAAARSLDGGEDR